MAGDAIRGALVLVADHELNASTFTVRCVASTGASPYGAVAAGPCALSGPRHGGALAQVAAFFREVDREPDGASAAVRDRMRRGERVPGFGHPLYPDGDPRARFLLGQLGGKNRLTARRLAAVATAEELLGARPSLDVALPTFAEAHELPAGAAFALFAIGRVIGWIAHAQEQYQSAVLIRPRARYIGEAPPAAKGA